MHEDDEEVAVITRRRGDVTEFLTIFKRWSLEYPDAWKMTSHEAREIWDALDDTHGVVVIEHYGLDNEHVAYGAP